MTDSPVRPIRWGILSTGGIAGTFTDDLLLLDDHEVVAVGSRNAATAEAFADQYGIDRAYGSYAELAADDNVDVVYVATPHSGHYAASLECLRAGRAVLCEKSFTVTGDEAAELVAVARERQVFLMEAMWTRFNPAVTKLHEVVADGVIGELRSVLADFCLVWPYDPEHRLFNPELGGGALLDLGIYPVSFAWMLLGAPSRIEAVAGKAPNGVDANTGILFGYDDGATALLYTSLQAKNTGGASILGTRGRIDVHPPFHRPTSFTVHPYDGEQWTHTVKLSGRGYTYQAEEVARRLRAGELESPIMPLDESVAIMRGLDEIRERISR